MYCSTLDTENQQVPLISSEDDSENETSDGYSMLQNENDSFVDNNQKIINSITKGTAVAQKEVGVQTTNCDYKMLEKQVIKETKNTQTDKSSVTQNAIFQFESE